MYNFSQMNKTIINQTFLSLILSALLSGCFIFGEPTEFDETTGRSDLWILQQSENFAENRDWVKAADYLEKAEKRFPNSKLAPQIKLNLAYAYKNGFREAEAIGMLEKFIRTYPNHPSMDYAYYLKGVVLFRDRGLVKKITMQDISDRDVTQLELAFQALKELTLVFPESKYTPDSIIRMSYLMNKIAERELHVARYYMKRKAYVAALNRAKYVLENYRQSIHQEEALVISISAYEHLGIEDLKKDTERILEKNYPDSKFDKQKLTSSKKDWWRFWESLYN
jgi:outer membrane protein assembly factor BamD